MLVAMVFSNVFSHSCSQHLQQTSLSSRGCSTSTPTSCILRPNSWVDHSWLARWPVAWHQGKVRAGGSQKTMDKPQINHR